MAQRSRAKKATKKNASSKKGEVVTLFKAKVRTGSNSGEGPDDELYDRHLKILMRHNSVIDKKAAELKELKAARAADLGVAKDDGCDTDAMKDAIKLDQKDKNMVMISQSNIGRVLRLLKSPLAVQLNLFQDIEIPDAVNAAVDGLKAGKAGADRTSNPHKPGTEEFVQWDGNWLSGQKTIVDKMGKKGEEVPAKPAAAGSDAKH